MGVNSVLFFCKLVVNICFAIEWASTLGTTPTNDAVLVDVSETTRVTRPRVNDKLTT
jgi:hypothetical protein